MFLVIFAVILLFVILSSGFIQSAILTIVIMLNAIVPWSGHSDQCHSINCHSSECHFG